MDLCGSRLYKPWLIPLSICLIYPFPVISNATHFMCAVIWVCWLSLLDSSLLSYRIHVISLLCRSMHSVSSIPDCDAGLWLTLSSGYLMLLHVSCDILTSLLVLLFPSGLLLILWFLVYMCLHVDCLMVCCMWQPLKCMLWAWSTHGVHGRCERGWLDRWEWKMVVWL